MKKDTRIEPLIIMMASDLVHPQALATFEDSCLHNFTYTVWVNPQYSLQAYVNNAAGWERLHKRYYQIDVVRFEPRTYGRN